MARGWSDSFSTARRILIGVSAITVFLAHQATATASCGDYLMPLGSHHSTYESMPYPGQSPTTQWDPNTFLSPYFPANSSHDTPSRSLCEGGRCQQAPAAPPIENWTSAAPRQFAVSYATHTKNALASKSAWLFPVDSGKPEVPFLEVLSPPPRG